MNGRGALAVALFVLLLPAICGAQQGGEARWSSYRDFWFDYDSAVVDGSHRENIRDAANYLRQHPSYRLAIDTGASDDSVLRNQRVAAIRDALIAAGVPKYKIQEGRFGDDHLRRDRRVEILIDSRD